MARFITANPDDDTFFFQLSEATLDGSFRNAYLGGVFCIVGCTVFRDSVIYLLFYRVVKLFYRVRSLRLLKRFYLFGDVSDMFLHHELTERFKRLLFT